MRSKINPFLARMETIGVDFIVSTRAPTSADASFSAPFLWLDATHAIAYLLLGVAADVAAWIRLADPDYDAMSVMSVDDATLSGVPILLRFSAAGSYYYVPAYPTISGVAGATGDPVGDNPYGLFAATLSGVPRVFSFVSGGATHYVTAYPVASATTGYGGDNTRRPSVSDLTAVSGVPRCAKMVIAGTDFYFKMYPTK